MLDFGTYIPSCRPGFTNRTIACVLHNHSGCHCNARYLC